MAEQAGTTLQAFGQIWYFSPEVLVALQPMGIRARSTLKTLIINISPWGGLPDGVHHLIHLGVKMTVEVSGDSISVGIYPPSS